MVGVVGLGSEGPEFKYCSAVELIPGAVNSTCHPSEVGKMSASMLVYCVGAVTHPELCPIAKETASAAPMLCTEYGPNGWMDGCFWVAFLLYSMNEARGRSMFNRQWARRTTICHNQ